jgi:hypothetical protein
MEAFKFLNGWLMVLLRIRSCTIRYVITTEDLDIAIDSNCLQNVVLLNYFVTARISVLVR